jgi:hypothetical protein
MNETLQKLHQLGNCATSCSSFGYYLLAANGFVRIIVRKRDGARFVGTGSGRVFEH